MSGGKRAAIIVFATVIVVAIVAVVPGLTAGSGRIRDWHDLHAIGENTGGHYRLMNDLDATAAGYA